MFSESFEYHAPGTLQEATALLGQYGDDAKVLTGGMSLIPLMKLRLAAPAHLVDLRKIGDIKGIREAGGRLEIGALSTYDDIENSSLVKSKCPLLAQTAAEVGDVQVRNRGTIGGCLVHADPAADLPAALVALDAQVTLMGKAERTIPVGEFLVDVMESAIGADEILTKISVPVTGASTAYLKLAQQASGFALVGVAVCLELEGGTCKSAQIGITGVCGKAFRANSVENALAGKALDDAAVASAVETIGQDFSNPLEDPINASAEYRTHLTKIFTARAIKAALG